MAGKYRYPEIPTGVLEELHPYWNSLLRLLAVKDDKESEFSTSSNFKLDAVTIVVDTTVNSHPVTLADATTLSLNLSLPTAESAQSKVFYVKKIDATANTVTITPNGVETIDGAATKVLTTQYEVTSIVSDGSNWHII